ncbi:MAG: M23 family metallopeptidase [Verrucomicrobia bacterium]|nr:M23 family metallopeptidase [Verrucomicrobiota bacterium]
MRTGIFSASQACALAWLILNLGPSALRAADRLNLALPTANDALFHDDPAAFYQYVERNFHDQVTYPWEGGQYGFVRDPIDTPIGVLYVRFHEGIDIRPLRRDAKDEPLDEVLATAPGRIVHTSSEPRASNYGRYLVIEHRWDGCPYYSLYAHLSEIWVNEGDIVARAQPVARMGHTGEGIDRPRSHLHFELNLMLSRNFDTWYQTNASSGPNDPNKHGPYNGQNLAGLDIARLLLALQKKPDLTLPEFFAQEETFFRVLIPAGPEPPDLLRLYPWMGNGAPPSNAPHPAAWEISFNRTGLPLKVLPSDTAVSRPTLSFAQPAAVPYWQLTHRLIYGSGNLPTLSPYGIKLINLIAQPKVETSPVFSPTPK